MSCYDCDMIEKSPKEKQSNVLFKLFFDDKVKNAIDRVNKEYLYWDKAKYYVPDGLNSEDFWSVVKFSRRLQYRYLFFSCCTIKFNETHQIQELLHNIDMNFGGTLSSELTISGKKQQYYLISSIMEEAIASSQMEGATTTRKVAKDMLRKQIKPKNVSQQMILNNYNTIRFLAGKKEETLTLQFLLDVHKSITENTLEDKKHEGALRTDDTIVVQDALTGEIVHNPPSHDLIEPSLLGLCDFINNEDKFIHPIVKAVVLHFLIAYIHPFADGNGRTARSLFYWYMLKKGYWLTEFLSISRVIYRSKKQYESVFLYTEGDEMDLTYFLDYNLDVMRKAYGELQHYLEKKAQEEKFLMENRIPGINERQSQIIKSVMNKGNSIFISRELETVMNVSVKTIRSDLEGLVKLGLLDKIPINKRLYGYTKSPNFESILREVKGN